MALGPVPLAVLLNNWILGLDKLVVLIPTLSIQICVMIVSLAVSSHEWNSF